MLFNPNTSDIEYGAHNKRTSRPPTGAQPPGADFNAIQQFIAMLQQGMQGKEADRLAQHELNRGVLFGRHLGTGGGEGGNSSGPGINSDPFTSGYFKQPSQREGLQTTAGIGAIPRAEPFKPTGYVGPQEWAQMFQGGGFGSGTTGTMTPYGPVARKFRAPAVM